MRRRDSTCSAPDPSAPQVSWSCLLLTWVPRTKERNASHDLAGFWRLKDKLGLTLDEIHFQGAVPNYAEKYQKAMNKFFTNLREDKLVERNNVSRPAGVASSCLALYSSLYLIASASCSTSSRSKAALTGLPRRMARRRFSTNSIKVRKPTRLSSKGQNSLRAPPSERLCAASLLFLVNVPHADPRSAHCTASPRCTSAASGKRFDGFLGLVRSSSRFGMTLSSCMYLGRHSLTARARRTYLLPVTSLAHEPGVPGRMASGVRVRFRRILPQVKRRY